MRTLPRLLPSCGAANSALALELCILTAARSGEILGMRWSEIDLDKKIWTVPANRMKAGREHRVPLSARAAAILRQHEKLKTGDFVFAGQAPKAAFEYGNGDGATSHEDYRRHRSRLPLQLPGLGGQRLKLPARNH
jgi:integrase